MSRRTTGWLFGGAQAVLLIALVFLPGGDDWAKPSWLLVIAQALVIMGFVIMAIAAFGLGTALTPTPVPSGRGELTTTGLYGFVRHPIYSAVLLLVAGITLRSGSWLHLILAVVTVVFFNWKARWEEQQLATHFAGYDTYAKSTPRFLPRPGRRD